MTRQNLIALYDDRAAGATLSWGSFEPDLPRDNLKDEALYRPARTAGLDLSDTRLRIEFPAVHYVRGIVLGPGNLSPLYQYRIRSWAEPWADMLTDTGWVFPAQDRGGQGPIHWGEDGFWLGSDNRESYLIHIFDDVVPGQYWTVEIDDQDNEAGYLDFGRLFMAMGWQPSINYSFDGNGLTWVNNNLTANTLAGGTKHWRRRSPRRFSCTFGHLPESEAYEQAYRLIETIGFDQPAFVVPDPDHLQSIDRRSFFARLNNPSTISQPFFQLAALGLEFQEIIN